MELGYASECRRGLAQCGTENIPEESDVERSLSRISDSDFQAALDDFINRDSEEGADPGHDDHALAPGKPGLFR